MPDLIQTIPALLILAALLLQTAARRSADRRLRSELAGEIRELGRRLEALTVSPEFERIPEIEPAPAPIVAPVAPTLPPRSRVDPPAPSAVPGPTLITVPSMVTQGSESAAAAASAELSRRFGAIWALADSGASADAVARAVGQPVGQVELILALRRQMLQSGETPAAESNEAQHES